jgi:hypothetical protein
MSAQLVHADDQQPSVVLGQNASSPHSGVAEFVALQEYVRQIGSEQSNPVASREKYSPHPHFENADFLTLREYAREVASAIADAFDRSLFMT